MSINHLVRLAMPLAAALSIGITNRSHAQTSDPTQMSPQIAELLQGMSTGRGEKPGESEEEETDETPIPALLRMRGIILRNDQMGTACVELGEDRVVIPLDREKLGKIRFSIGGEKYELLDFQYYGLELRNLSTAETINVN